MLIKRHPFIYTVTKRIAHLVFSFFYKIQIEGKGSLGDQGPVVILPKHQYWTDIPLVGLAFHPQLYFVAKKELFRYPLLRHYISLGGGIPVDREKSIRTLDSFKTLITLLKANERIVIFPEGTYFRNRVGSGKSRLLQMILKFQEELKQKIPFIPVGIRYGEKKGWRRRVEICIGSPLFGGGESDAAALTEKVMEEISRLCRLPQSIANCRLRNSE
ncbi:MAG: 1-acyl-sn-glycerol-3-phosphate acyltransferase [Deltaproteobacteria bacterium]|nr:1-acyl-sn-glycerol-3-phosphate acyltransferase [Deltaproteobacteria bacterium]